MSIRTPVLSKSSLIFAVRIFGAGLIFLVQAAMARLWSPELLAEYLVAIAAANLLAISLPLGFQTIGTYFAAEYAAAQKGGALLRFALLAYALIVFPGLAIIYLGSVLIGQFGDVGHILEHIWQPVSLMAAGTAIIYVNGAILIGLKRPYAGFFGDTIFRPLLVIGAFVIAFAMAEGAERVLTMLWWLAGSYMVVALIHFAFTWRAILLVPRTAQGEKSEFSRWWYFAPPWLLIALSSDFFFDLDLLVLTTLLDREQIAIFGICARIFILASFGVAAVYAVSLPDFLKEEANRDEPALIKKLGEANLIALGLGLVLLVLIALFSPLVLSLFGPAFNAGVLPLLILCTSIVVRAVFGPGSVILSSRKRPYASVPAIAIMLVVLLAGNFLLTPPLGLIGAALAATGAFSAGSFALWWTTKRLTGLDVSVFPAVQALIKQRS